MSKSFLFEFFFFFFVRYDPEATRKTTSIVRVAVYNPAPLSFVLYTAYAHNSFEYFREKLNAPRLVQRTETNAAAVAAASFSDGLYPVRDKQAVAGA